VFLAIKVEPKHICSEVLRKVYLDFVKYRKWLFACGLRTQVLPKTNKLYFYAITIQFARRLKKRNESGININFQGAEKWMN
jgi:hypothetical protein